MYLMCLQNQLLFLVYVIDCRLSGIGKWEIGFGRIRISITIGSRPSLLNILIPQNDTQFINKSVISIDGALLQVRYQKRNLVDVFARVYSLYVYFDPSSLLPMLLTFMSNEHRSSLHSIWHKQRGPGMSLFSLSLPRSVAEKNKKGIWRRNNNNATNSLAVFTIELPPLSLTL